MEETWVVVGLDADPGHQALGRGRGAKSACAVRDAQPADAVGPTDVGPLEDEDPDVALIFWDEGLSMDVAYYSPSEYSNNCADLTD